MKLRIGKVWPALALAVVIVVPGGALAQSAGSTGAAPPLASMVLKRLEASLGFVELRAKAGIAGQSGLSGLERSGRQYAAELRAVQPVGPARISALVISSLGMFGLIALHRLTRTF